MILGRCCTSRYQFRSSPSAVLNIRAFRSTATCDKTEARHENGSVPFVFKVAGVADKYNPRMFEKTRYDACMHAEYFSPSTSPNPQGNFSMLLPPPNVTGSLHLGHVLTVAIQDAIVRHRRMSGYRVNWLPGLDHAGIATQVQVENHLALTRKDGRTRHDMGRAQFVRECYLWKEERAAQINEQLQRVGASLNWKQLTFTLDPHIVENVERIFTELFERGFIYREKMLVMHCPYLCSTISDIEVDWMNIYKEQDITVPSFPGDVVKVGYMLHFAYLLFNADRQATNTDEIVVATTRPETMLGDVAVAVHPDDSRYTHLIGRRLVHPFVPYRTIPVIADTSVDSSFGTGAVKITPAHDFNDFALAIRHGLGFGDQVIDENGNIACDTVPDFHGKNRFHVRKTIEQALHERGLVRLHESNIKTRVPFCSRSQDIVEPMLKEQWFLATSEFESQAKEAVDSGQLKFTPPFFADVFRNWMQQRQDWCLSRQLWWGIQIPAYKVTFDAGDAVWVCARDEHEARRKAVEKLSLLHSENSEQLTVKTLIRDSDVLDTWFSSGALPFLTSTDAANPTYPLSLMETGHDIIFFWVARMVMLGFACTGQLPFNRVLLHGLVCDEQGKKMSKSKGNVIDPMRILCDTDADRRESSDSTAHARPTDSDEKADFAFDIGADAMRFALLRHNNLAVQLDLNVKRDIEAANRFCNKIWQSVRFILAVWEANGIEPDSIRSDNKSFLSIHEILASPLASPLDRWLLSRLSHVVCCVDDALRNTFEMQRATEALHRFWLENICDVYIECIKPVVKNSDLANADRRKIILSVLHHVVDGFLRIMHPFMPFITDELNEHIVRYDGRQKEQREKMISLCVSSFPTLESVLPLVNAEIDELFDVLLRAAHEVRSLKSRYNALNLPMPVKIILHTYQNDETSGSLPIEFLSALKVELCVLMRSPLVQIAECADENAAESLLGPEYGITAVTRAVQVAVKLEGFIDFEKERERVVKKHSKLLSNLASLDRKLRRRTVADKEELQRLETKRAQIVQELDVLDGMAKHLNLKTTIKTSVREEEKAVGSG